MDESSRAGGPMPFGAEVLPGGGVRFRVWAPGRRRVAAVIEGGPGARGGGREVELAAEREGFFSATAADAGPGTLYRFRLDGSEPMPDPASRFQPEGVHGPSEVIDPRAYRWGDAGWSGRSIRGQVLYELHVGTFTPEGTWEAAARELPHLAELGITVLEVMPINEFSGKFGWGYDGVDWYAPTRLYGRPDDFRRFVDRAHALGLAVILDVVYNHFGAEGMYWKEYSKDFFTDKYQNDWGEAINFDGPGSGPVRDFVTGNAAYWVREFHLDGLRIDATQALNDESPEEISLAVARAAREAAGGRATIVVGENEPQRWSLLRPDDPAQSGLDALWNDDFHHVARVALTGRREGYYGDYHGSAQEFVSAIKRGFLYQGQLNRRQEKRRGSPPRDVPREAFVTFLQNHDQVANSHTGERCHRLASPGVYRALTAAWLLGPGTPMVFQGQEFAASSRFFYFADHVPELRGPTREGRVSQLGQFPSYRQPETVATMADPGDPATFERSKLDHREREAHPEALALHRDLIRLRRDDPAFAAQGAHGIDGAVLGPEAFVLRFSGPDPDSDRLLLVNLGTDLFYTPPTEPLLAPPEGRSWRVLWTSEAVAYGGSGTPEPETPEGWRIQGRAAAVLAPLGDGSPGPSPAMNTPDETEQHDEEPADGDDR